MAKFKQNIICGDCLEVLKTIPDESVDLVITDPPYKLRTSSAKVRESGLTNDRLRNRWVKKGKKDEDNESLVKSGQMIANIPKFEDWLPELFRVLKNGTHCYIMINGANFSKLQVAAEKVGFKFQNNLIWYKQNCTPSKFYQKRTECILMLRKGKERYINNMGDDDVFFVKNPVGQKLHITEKPVELYAKMLLNSSDVGDTVLDPFAGAMGLAVACKENNRNSICIDVLDKNCELGKKRLKAAESGYFQGGLF